MASEHHKLDEKLVKSPVDYLCGNPNDRKPSLSSDEEIYGLKGPDGLSANGGIETALIYSELKPSTADVKPSDSGTFKGTGEDSAKHRRGD